MITGKSKQEEHIEDDKNLGGADMATYIVQTKETEKYQKNYGLPLINIIPAVVWSIPMHQKLFPDANFG